VKVLQISEYGGYFKELKQMRHFLGKLECLETVKVGVHAENNNNSEFLPEFQQSATSTSSDFLSLLLYSNSLWLRETQNIGELSIMQV